MIVTTAKCDHCGEIIILFQDAHMPYVQISRITLPSGTHHVGRSKLDFCSIQCLKDYVDAVERELACEHCGRCCCGYHGHHREACKPLTKPARRKPSTATRTSAARGDAP